MANTNGIRWNDQQVLTDNAARMAISAMGNVANGFQALGANFNAGLDKLIDRYDTIDAKNKASNTQLLINQLHQADSLADREALTRQGMKNLGSVRNMLNGAEFDERAYNTALAQWDEGINNRFLANDALKMSTPQGQADYLAAQQAIASNNAVGIREVLQRDNLPLATVNGLAQAAQGIGINDLSRSDRLAAEEFNKEQLKIQQGFQTQALNKYMADTELARGVITENAKGAYVGGVANAVAQFGGIHRLRDLSTSKDPQSQEIYKTIKSSLAPQLIPFGWTVEQFLHNPEAFYGAINSGAYDSVFSFANGNNTAPRDAINNTGSNMNQESSTELSNRQSQEIQSIVNNNQLSQQDKQRALEQLRTKHETELARLSVRNVGSNTNNRFDSSNGIGSYNDLVQGGNYADLNTPYVKDTVGAYKEIAEAAGIDTNGWLDPTYTVDKKSPNYTAAQSMYQNLSPNERARFLQRMRDVKTYSDKVQKDFDKRYNINLGNGKSIPMSKLMDTKLTDEEQNLFNDVMRLRENGYADQAEMLIQNTLFGNDSGGLDGALPRGFTFQGEAARNFTAAMDASNNDPNIAKMYINMVRLGRNGKQGSLANWGTDSPEAKNILSSTAALRAVNPEAVKRYSDEYAIMQQLKQLSPTLLRYYISGSGGNSIEAALRELGTPEQKRWLNGIEKEEREKANKAREEIRKRTKGNDLLNNTAVRRNAGTFAGTLY